MRFSGIKRFAAAAALSACATLGHGAVVVSSIDDFSTGFDADEWNSYDVSYNVGRFEFSAAGNILSATLTGTFGNAVSPASTEMTLYGDGIEVASCGMFDECLFNTSEPLLTFSYVFSADDLATLADGSFELSAYKAWIGAVHLGSLRLEIVNDLASEVPEPMSAALLLAGLAGLGWSRRARR